MRSMRSGLSSAESSPAYSCSCVRSSGVGTITKVAVSYPSTHSTLVGLAGSSVAPATQVHFGDRIVPLSTPTQGLVSYSSTLPSASIDIASGTLTLNGHSEASPGTVTASACAGPETDTTAALWVNVWQDFGAVSQADAGTPSFLPVDLGHRWGPRIRHTTQAAGSGQLRMAVRVQSSSFMSCKFVLLLDADDNEGNARDAGIEDFWIEAYSQGGGTFTVPSSESNFDTYVSGGRQTKMSVAVNANTWGQGHLQFLTTPFGAGVAQRGQGVSAYRCNERRATGVACANRRS